MPAYWSSPSRPASFSPSSLAASSLRATDENRHWFSVGKDRLWPPLARYICKHLLDNFEGPGNEDKKREQMAKELAARPPQWPITAEWLNFVLRLFWSEIEPSVSNAVKELLTPKLHSALNMVAPVEINPCRLGSEPPKLDEVELLEDQGLGNWMDLKLHCFWHSEPDITVSCKLGSVALPKLKLGFTVYMGLHGECDEPPFFRALMMYMGNGFMHAGDVLNTGQARKDPYIGMTFGDAWTGFNISFVEDAVVSALNGAIAPKLVLPHRMVFPMGSLRQESSLPMDLVMPRPRGCLRITVIGVSKGLVGTEWKLQSLLTGDRSNDPYVTVDLGGARDRMMRTPTCYGDLTPVWEEDNVFHFVVDALGLQHLNFRIYDDGLLQLFREQQIGTASHEDLMARKLGVSVMELFGTRSMNFFDQEQKLDTSCMLDTSWPGHEREDQTKAQLNLSIHWRPIIESKPSLIPQEVFVEDDEDLEPPLWPRFVLRIGLQSLQMQRFKGKRTDMFFAKVAMLPGFNAAGCLEEEPKEGLTEVHSKKVYPQHQGEDRSEMVSRMSGGLLGHAGRVAYFDQGFRFLVHNPTSSKVHLTFYSVADFDKTDVTELGEMTVELNSLLQEKTLSMDLNEPLDNWTGDAPGTFKGHFQLFQIHHSAMRQAMAGSHMQMQTKTAAKQDAMQMAQRASKLRAEAEALEREAHKKNREMSRRSKSNNHMLKVRIIGARGLRAADFSLTSWNTSDPYCVCESGSKSFKTPVIDKTLEPFWDYEGVLNHYKVGSPLKFTVYDKDWSYKDDELGHVTLSGSKLTHGFVGELLLVGAGGSQEAYLKVAVADSYGVFPQDPDDIGGSKLKVRMNGARGFVDAQKGFFGREVSCLYAKCEIPNRARCSMRSQAIEHSGEPEWNYERHMSGFKQGDSLVISVLHEKHGAGKDVVLATRTMSCDEFFPKGFAGMVDLEPQGSSWGGSKLELGSKPQMELQISDSEGKFPKLAVPDSALQVKIVSARGLRAADTYVLQEHSSDPYCVCEVMGKPYSRFRTHTIQKTLVPTWGYKHRLRGYAEGDSLKFTVYDEDWVSQDDELGYVVLKGEEFHRDGFSGERRLITGNDAVESFIQGGMEGEKASDEEAEEEVNSVAKEVLLLMRKALSVFQSWVCGKK